MGMTITYLGIKDVKIAKKRRFTSKLFVLPLEVNNP